jgi:SAM-dependent methyltransferase
MAELWRIAAERTSAFDAAAVAYDTYRPRYPDGVFDDIVELGGLGSGGTAVEIGAGTGIATAPLVGRGLQVTAIEPSPTMAALGQAKGGDGATWVVGRFEDWTPAPIDLVASFNAWHWVEPTAGLDRVAAALRPGGALALVWTVVASWGGEAFEHGLAEAFGAPWPKTLDHVLDSRRHVEQDERFDGFIERRHRFERTLDADTYVEVTRTYGARLGEEGFEALRRLIGRLGGSVTKVEEAALYLARRR